MPVFVVTEQMTPEFVNKMIKLQMEEHFKDIKALPSIALLSCVHALCTYLINNCDFISFNMSGTLPEVLFPGTSVFDGLRFNSLRLASSCIQ